MRSIHKDHLQASFYDRRKTLCTPELHVYLCLFCSRIRVSSQSQFQRWSCLFFVRRVDLHMACLFQVCPIVSHTKKSHVPSPVYQYTLGLESCASWQLRVCSPHYVKLLFISLSTGIGNLPCTSSSQTSPDLSHKDIFSLSEHKHRCSFVCVSCACL